MGLFTVYIFRIHGWLEAMPCVQIFEYPVGLSDHEILLVELLQGLFLAVDGYYLEKLISLGRDLENIAYY
jgi:hypothetical protein